MKCPKCGNPVAKYKESRKRVVVGLERRSKKRTDWTILCKKCGEVKE